MVRVLDIWGYYTVKLIERSNVVYAIEPNKIHSNYFRLLILNLPDWEVNRLPIIFI